MSEEEKPPTLRESGYRAILEALARNNGRKGKTALELGISRTSLYRILKKKADEKGS